MANSEKLKIEIVARLQNGQHYSTIIEIYKSEYDEADDKESFLQQIHDELISEVVTSYCEILEDK